VVRRAAFGHADGVERPERRRLLVLVGPAVAAGAVYGPALEAFDVLSDNETWNWPDALLRGACFAVMMTVLRVAVRRHSEDTLERAAVARVLSAGTLPQGAEPEEWVGRLRVARHRFESDRVAAPGFAVLLSGLVAAAAVRSTGPDVGVGLYGAALALAGVVLGVRQHRRLYAADRLSAELEERLAPA
jgi:hypothetical protein